MDYSVFKFKRLSDLCASPGDYKSDLYLTFDVDWARDEIIADTLDLLSMYNVPATFFCTHDSPLMRNLLHRDYHELGIHPNFNPLLANATNGVGLVSIQAIVQRLVNAFPKAKALRSHSLVSGDPITRVVARSEIKLISNTLVPYWNNISIAPYYDWYGLLHVPYLFQDSLVFYSDRSVPPMNQLCAMSGIKVFNFHPIHVYLNSNTLGTYEGTRHLHGDPYQLQRHRYHGYGTRSRLIELLSMAGKPSC